MRPPRPAHRRVSGAAVMLGFGLAVLTGCTDEPRTGEPTSTASTPGGGGPAGTADPQPPSPAPPLPAPSPTGDGDAPGAVTPGPTVTAQGTVTAGVEAGCLVLETDDGTYELLGVPADVGPGDRVTVHGHTPPDLATTCQQGVPLLVERTEVERTGTD